jgi:hypothetical protein
MWKVILVLVFAVSGCDSGGSGPEPGDVAGGCDSSGSSELDAGPAGEAGSGGPCNAVVAQFDTGAYVHEETGSDLCYESVPPCIGAHWGTWTAWGENADAVPPEVYVHNLEHGGVALLYDCPEGCDDAVSEFRTYAEGVPDDDGGAFRYVLTPFSGLPGKVAAAAWGWTWNADCVDPEALSAFVDAHYRDAPEDVPSSGNFMP